MIPIFIWLIIKYAAYKQSLLKEKNILFCLACALWKLI